MIEQLQAPWPWYIAGAMIGLIVPALLILGNKSFGISSSMRHVCAACFPADIKFFKYNWKQEAWNFFFIIGIILGAFIAMHFLKDPNPVIVNETLKQSLSQYGINNYDSLLPAEIFSFPALFTLRGAVMLIGGGFLVGFGTRYAGGCTSGHSIMGLSSLQWPSLVATICFMIGGFLMSNLILPFILSL
jgi:uncharacterized membrane protein YedE/YeeE